MTRDRKILALLVAATLGTAAAYEAAKVPEEPFTREALDIYQAPVHSIPPPEYSIGEPCWSCRYKPDLPRVVVEEGD